MEDIFCSMATSSSLIGLIQSCEDNTAPSASHISATYKLLAEGSIGSSRMIHELANAFLQHPRDTGIILHFSSGNRAS